MTGPRLTPGYRLAVGGYTVDTTRDPAASVLLDLTVALDLGTPVDAATLALADVPGVRPARGDRVGVALGYAGDEALVDVFTGTVADVRSSLTGTRVVAHGAAAALLRCRTDRTYESKTAGDIVRDIAATAGIPVTRADAGTAFPAYVVDGRRAGFAHLRDLADLCGCDVYVDPAGGLVFERFTGGRTVHLLGYARDLLDLAVRVAPAAVEAVQVWGESPGTGRGAHAWAWLVKDFRPSLGSAGSGGTPLLLEHAALRTADAAATAAAAALSAVRRRTVRGRLMVAGRPEIALGDGVRITDVPAEHGGADVNGVWQVRAVCHRLVRRRGFTTTVEFQPPP